MTCDLRSAMFAIRTLGDKRKSFDGKKKCSLISLIYLLRNCMGMTYKYNVIIRKKKQNNLCTYKQCSIILRKSNKKTNEMNDRYYLNNFKFLNFLNNLSVFNLVKICRNCINNF